MTSLKPAPGRYRREPDGPRGINEHRGWRDAAIGVSAMAGDDKPLWRAKVDTIVGRSNQIFMAGALVDYRPMRPDGNRNTDFVPENAAAEALDRTFVIEPAPDRENALLNRPPMAGMTIAGRDHQGHPMWRNNRPPEGGQEARSERPRYRYMGEASPMLIAGEMRRRGEIFFADGAIVDGEVTPVNDAARDAIAAVEAAQRSHT